MGNLTCNVDPLGYFFSRNRMFVQIETDNHTYSVNNGTKAQCYFAFLHNAVLNDTLTINWGTGSQVYTFKAATNMASFEVAHIAGGQDPFEYCAQLANDLMTHAALAAVAIVGAYQTSVHFEALTAGTTYSFASSSTTVSGAAFYNEAATDALETVARPNYRICVDVYCGSDLVVSIAKEPSNNVIEFDLSQYVDNYLSYDRPSFTSATLHTPNACPNVIKAFHYKISEVYGETPVAQSSSVTGTTIANTTDNVHTTDPHYVLKAGFDELTAKHAPALVQRAWLVLHKPFLTLQPRTKYISANSYEWLYFCFTSTPLNNKASIKYTFTDAAGATSTLTTHDVAGVTTDSVYCFPVHYEGSYMATYVRMDVCVVATDDGTVLSEVFTFIRDDEYRPEEVYFHFDNSLGGFDTVRCFGKFRQMPEIEEEEASRTVTVNDTRYQGDRVGLYSQRRNAYTTNSGFQRKTDLQWMEGFFLSREKFGYMPVVASLIGNWDSYYRLVPIGISGREWVPHETNRNLFAWRFDYFERLASELPSIREYPVV